MAATDVESPVRLTVERGEGTVTLRVSGAAVVPVDVTYQLDVDGASTLHQAGRARLAPRENETLVLATINADRPWRVILRVDAGGHRFEQTAASDMAVDE